MLSWILLIGTEVNNNFLGISARLALSGDFSPPAPLLPIQSLNTALSGYAYFAALYLPVDPMRHF
jgi:hypothetical protein